MVELQIVILAVAGSSPVGHPGVISRRKTGCRISREMVAQRLLSKHSVINPTLHSTTSSEHSATEFWLRIFNDGALQNCGDLEKLVAGCEVIAALDDLDLLAA